MHEIRISVTLSPKRTRNFLAAALILAFPLELGSETLTLTTTYPSPAGVYNSLITTGNGAANNTTALNRNGGNTLLVQNSTNPGGWVGVGATAATADPRGSKLNLGGNVDMNGFTIMNVAPLPVNPNDAASKAYVDAQVGGGPGGWTCAMRSATGSVSSWAASASINCSAGEKVISGGCIAGLAGNGDVSWIQNSPTPGAQGWQCAAWSNQLQSVTASANCCK